MGKKTLRKMLALIVLVIVGIGFMPANSQGASVKKLETTKPQKKCSAVFVSDEQKAFETALKKNQEQARGVREKKKNFSEDQKSGAKQTYSDLKNVKKEAEIRKTHVRLLDEKRKKRHIEKVKQQCRNKEELIKKMEEKKKQEKQEKLRKLRETKEYKERMSLEEMLIPRNVGNFKSWMSYKAVTAEGTMQYQILNSENASTDKEGFRRVGKFYCIALGSYYSDLVGTRFKITLEDGTVFYAVLGDQKSDAHTDKKHQYHVKDHSVIEFIMGEDSNRNAVSIAERFGSPIKRIQRYKEYEDVWNDKNALKTAEKALTYKEFEVARVKDHERN